MSSSDSEITEFLNKLKLLKYKDKFREDGPHYVENVGDFIRFLSELNLLKEIGMTVFEVNRFKRLCEKTIEEFDNAERIQISKPRTEDKFGEAINGKDTAPKYCSARFSNLNVLRIRTKILTQEHILRKSTVVITVDLSWLYYQLISMIHKSLQRDVHGIVFESVELYSATGYPLALNPPKYFEQISKWNLEQNDLLYIYPKKIQSEKIISYTRYKDPFHIKVRIEKMDVSIQIELRHVVIFCCDLKTLISLQLHLPAEILTLQFLYINDNIKEKPDDRLELELKQVEDEHILISVQILESFWKGDSYLGAFKSSLYTSCIPQNMSDWDCFNCLLLYLSRVKTNIGRERLLSMLGLVRRISCSPPLVLSLHRLLNESKLYLPHRVAINEGIITTLSLLISESNPGIENFSMFWMYLEKYAENKHKDTEVYETQYISKYTRESPKDHEIKKLLQAFPEAEDVIVTWRNCPSAYEPFLYRGLSVTEFSQNKIMQRFPLKHPIELYQEFINNGDNYGLLRPPSQLSSYYIFLGRTKGRYGYFDFFNPNDGERVSWNPQDKITSENLHIENTKQYQMLIIILDISKDMDYGCYEYSAGRDAKEPNLITSSLEMALRIIELLVDSLIGLNCKYLLSIILISNSHQQFIRGVNVFQPLTLEYVKTLHRLREFLETTPLNENPYKRKPSQGIIVNALFLLVDEFKPYENTTQVFLLTNHYSERKYYGSKQNSIVQKLTHHKFVLNALILSDHKSHNLSEICAATKGKYFDQINITNLQQSHEKISSHYLLEYSSLIQDIVNPLNLDSYKMILSDFSKKLSSSESVLESAQTKKEKVYTYLFQSKKIPNIIYILKLISNYLRSPNPYCKIYSIHDNILNWITIIQGPENSPYQKSIMFLEFSFGIDFPRKPPTFRFLSYHYHPNIRKTGEICHPIIIEDYHPNITLRQMLDSIYDMLCFPIPSHAVRYKVFEIFVFYFDVFKRLVESFIEVFGSHLTLTDCLQDLCIKESLNVHPEPFLCPLTGELFDSPMITREGDSYERHAILQHLKHHQYDPLTKKIPLTEADLIPNTALLSAVHKYRKKCCEKEYWWEH
ncbi:hypothetical protein LOD99_14352 [Oopsacas minuta]|uniref:Uncharacterized protein n=1 Tax=Oopsacas minuta TaxID=111878 RepID=A0AAV7KJ94_9METZ|nr:hypothetical protein LOD99_14352 [Oopsacas minuta]